MKNNSVLVEYVTKNGQHIPIKVNLFLSDSANPIGVCQCGHFHTDHEKTEKMAFMGKCELCKCSEYHFIGFLDKPSKKDGELFNSKNQTKQQKTHAPWTQISFSFYKKEE